jgi:hypothetical protein
MNELIKVFDNEVLAVEIINEREFYIDVSGVSKKYNKQFTKWSNSERVKETLKKRKFSVSEPILNIGHSQKIHNSLLVSFARNISVDFEIWCDDIIYELLTNEKNKEIERLKAQKKLCNVYDGKWSSARGLVQHTTTDYSETEIKDFMYSMGLIAPIHKVTRFWRVTDKGLKSGLVKSDILKTPIYDMDKTIEYMDNFKNMLENMKPIEIDEE